jgi:glycosyltransferase involved in cell wall biosynthesis
MAPVWARTRIYVQPSGYESYGKAAVEAMAHGIPVIAHPTVGLLESLESAGIFRDRADRFAYLEAIRELDDEDRYRQAGARARRRALELETITVAQLEALELELRALA